MVDFLFVIIELLSLSLTVETLLAESCRSQRFSKGVGHFERRFQRERASPNNRCWRQSNRVIALSCSIKIATMHCLILSPSTRMSDRLTTPKTALAYARAEKMNVNIGN